MILKRYLEISGRTFCLKRRKWHRYGEVHFQIPVCGTRMRRRQIRHFRYHEMILSGHRSSSMARPTQSMTPSEWNESWIVSKANFQTTVKSASTARNSGVRPEISPVATAAMVRTCSHVPDKECAQTTTQWKNCNTWCARMSWGVLFQGFFHPKRMVRPSFMKCSMVHLCLEISATSKSRTLLWLI